VRTELEIVWKGDVPGLSEHRISVGAFAQPLDRLLRALRRIATNIVGNALDEKRAEVGRFAAAAAQLDIEIASVMASSAGFNTMITLNTPVGENLPLFNQLPEMTGTEFLESMEAESKGTMRDVGVRRYLESLPSGIQQQDYALHENGREIKSISILGLRLVKPLLELPHLEEIIGNVVGVGFEPGRSEVRLKHGDRPITLSATPSQVETALGLRGAEVKALALVAETHCKLLRIQGIGLPWPIPSRDDAIFKRWDGLLRRLAQ
jgi:hypothetical protein